VELNSTKIKKRKAAMSGLSIENISMRFDLPNGGSVQALRDVTLDLKAGELLSVLGPSGCGKTTLLNIIAGFLAPTEGKILLHGNKVTGPSAERGMVFQQGALFEWMNVRETVGFGPRMKGVGTTQAR
jgi:taurine transport system ATP-binding protein